MQRSFGGVGRADSGRRNCGFFPPRVRINPHLVSSEKAIKRVRLTDLVKYRCDQLRDMLVG